MTGLPTNLNVPFVLDGAAFHKHKIPLREAIKEILTDHDHICYIPQSSLDNYPGLDQDVRPEQIISFGKDLRVENVWLGSKGSIYPF
jgi:hypothetical protein